MSTGTGHALIPSWLPLQEVGGHSQAPSAGRRSAILSLSAGLLLPSLIIPIADARDIATVCPLSVWVDALNECWNFCTQSAGMIDMIYDHATICKYLKYCGTCTVCMAHNLGIRYRDY